VEASGRGTRDAIQGDRVAELGGRLLVAFQAHCRRLALTYDDRGKSVAIVTLANWAGTATGRHPRPLSRAKRDKAKEAKAARAAAAVPAELSPEVVAALPFAGA